MEDLSAQWISQNGDLQTLEMPMDIMQFQQLFQTKDLASEFQVLRHITETQFHVQKLHQVKPELNFLNRYPSIVPYELNRIQLLQTYINASRILSPYLSFPIICAQGPVPKSIQHFWNLIIQEKVKLIIMLTDLKKNSTHLCAKYWPDPSQPLYLDNLTLTLINQEEMQNSIIKRQIKYEFQGKSDIIEQYQWKDWEDQEAPVFQDQDTVKSCIDTLLTNLKIQQDLGEIVLVHCSAGVGRTGTLLALLHLQVELEFETSVSVFRTVRRLREQRWGMVQTPSQYQFVYQFTNCMINELFS